MLVCVCVCACGVNCVMAGLLSLPLCCIVRARIDKPLLLLLLLLQPLLQAKGGANIRPLLEGSGQFWRGKMPSGKKATGYVGQD